MFEFEVSWSVFSFIWTEFEDLPLQKQEKMDLKNVEFGHFSRIDASPVDTGRKLIVHKTFRRRPGRLLNVLYTFNLCPVYTW